VATELARQSDVIALGRDAADLCDPAACAAAIRAHAPEAVINAAAYTAVDKAEEEEDLATTINGAAPTAMAKTCAELGIPFVHISTDYVFDGSGDMARGATDAPTAPLGAYGRSKLAGEVGVAGRAAPLPSCARPGSCRPMGRISSRRCCGWAPLGVSCAWSTTRSAGRPPPPISPRPA
jgi:dTDP-4-dehydrorhamnose reductase